MNLREHWKDGGGPMRATISDKDPEKVEAAVKRAGEAIEEARQAMLPLGAAIEAAAAALASVWPPTSRFLVGTMTATPDKPYLDQSSEARHARRLVEDGYRRREDTPDSIWAT